MLKTTPSGINNRAICIGERKKKTKVSLTQRRVFHWKEDKRDLNRESERDRCSAALISRGRFGVTNSSEIRILLLSNNWEGKLGILRT